MTGRARSKTAQAQRARLELHQARVGDRLMLTTPTEGAQVVSVVEVGLDSEGDPLVTVVGPKGQRRLVDTPAVVSGRIQLSDDLKLNEEYLRKASYPTPKTGWTLDI